MQALTRQQARLVDRIAIQEFGIPGIVLMENAARGCVEEILRLLEPPQSTPHRAAILCGGGNNGGDGYAIARLLHNAGVSVSVYSLVDPATLKGDATVNRCICQRMAASALASHNTPPMALRDIAAPAQLAEAAREWKQAHVIVDALLGTGFSGVLREDMAASIRLCNDSAAEAKIPIVAVDLPSGLDCDTGSAQLAIRAALTVTFAAEKIGFQQPGSKQWTGRVAVAGIGAPPEAIAQALDYRC